MKKSRGKPPAQLERTKSSPQRQQSGGFGQSHGYGPAHGGPTSPGDVPADQTPAGPASVVPTPDSDEKEE